MIYILLTLCVALLAAPRMGGEPITAMITGIVLGILLNWLLLRWEDRRRP